MPRVVGDIRRFGWIGIAAADLSRRKKPFHAFYVTSRGTNAPVHVTAANPLCARRHADLVTRAVVADHGANGVSAVTAIIARLRRIVPTRVAHAVMNGVMPV